MGWLNEIRRYHFFKCGKCDHDFAIIRTSFDKDRDTPEIPCEKCSTIGQLGYKGWENADKIGLTGKVSKIAFDQNGRKAYKIGNTYLSKTKYDYMETGKIENQYTPEYERKLRDDEEKNEYLLKTETNRRRAEVKELKRELKRRANSKTGSRTVPQK